MSWLDDNFDNNLAEDYANESSNDPILNALEQKKIALETFINSLTMNSALNTVRISLNFEGKRSGYSKFSRLDMKGPEMDSITFLIRDLACDKLEEIKARIKEH